MTQWTNENVNQAWQGFVNEFLYVANNSPSLGVTAHVKNALDALECVYFEMNQNDGDVSPLLTQFLKTMANRDDVKQAIKSQIGG